MSTYKSNELISATDISRKFGTYLDKVGSGKVKKLGILKNNKIKAVMLSGEVYELFGDYLDDFLENIQINNEIKDRIKTKKEDYLDGENVLKKLGLKL